MRRAEYRLQLRVSELEGRLQRADRLAAAVDCMVRRGALNSRSIIADARLQYGDPFDEAEAERLMLETRPGMTGA